MITIKWLNLHLQSREYRSMKLVIMTKSTFFVEEDKIITTLFDEGLDNLHLNKPNSEPIYSERILTLLPEDCYKRITVHNHFYLTQEYRLKGIHIDDAGTEIPSYYKGRFSRTCNSLEELKGNKKNAEYVFLNNTFDAQGKDAPYPKYSFEQLKAAAKSGLIDKRVYALGGVTLDNIKMAKDLGFGGVVICEDLWNRFNIHTGLDFKELMAHFERLKKAVG